MSRLFREYPGLGEKCHGLWRNWNVDRMRSFLALPWGHHLALIATLKNPATRLWYVENAVAMVG
jgi:hypothetical protein